MFTDLNNSLTDSKYSTVKQILRHNNEMSSSFHLKEIGYKQNRVEHKGIRHHANNQISCGISKAAFQ
jgi:hypothetical protein